MGRAMGPSDIPPRHYSTRYAPFALTTLHVATGRGEQPGLAVVNNVSGNVSIFLHHGLKARVGDGSDQQS